MSYNPDMTKHFQIEYTSSLRSQICAVKEEFGDKTESICNALEMQIESVEAEIQNVNEGDVKAMRESLEFIECIKEKILELKNVMMKRREKHVNLPQIKIQDKHVENFNESRFCCDWIFAK